MLVVSVLVSPLAAAPDPDLFDGHTSSSSSVSSGGEDSSSSDEASALRICKLVELSQRKARW